MPITPLENGSKLITFEPPPPGFDLLKASEAELLRHGFPPRPNDPRVLTRYQRIFRRINGKLKYVEPIVQSGLVSRSFERLIDPLKPGLSPTTHVSNNWSGGIVFPPPNQSFKCLQAEWVVPNVSPPTQNFGYECAIWIGIDGFPSGELCQTGIRCRVYTQGTSIIREIQPWYEWYPSGQVFFTGVQVSGGDLVTMLLRTSGPGATTATGYIANLTTGATTSYGFTAPPLTAAHCPTMEKFSFLRAKRIRNRAPSTAALATSSIFSTRI
jgi:hypothetical protein